ncbi:MAG: hypothetical protein QOF52_1046 [Propionibacteriaceae bacterium]|jgi:hypothetical protein|nr:hypothetical protein [Propionibacteriaceae bacterium]
MPPSEPGQSDEGSGWLAALLRCRHVEQALVRGLRLLLATLLCVSGLLYGTGQRAHAAEPVPLVSITIDALDPSLPKRDGTITVSGRVRNITKDPLYRLQAIFWRNQAPITSRADFSQAVASASNEPFGARLTSSYQDLYQNSDPYLEPGQSASFTLKAKVSDLALSPTSGVYLMGVHVLQNGNSTAVGRARVFVPVLDDAPQNILQLTSVVLLTSRPSQIRTGVFADDHLATDVAPGGRLSALLEAARQPDMTYAVDPSLIDELKTMKGGYQVLSANGSTVAGSGTADAARWLEQFGGLAERDGYRLPYGLPDLAALAHSGSTSVLERAVEAAKRVPETSSLDLLAMPAGGAADLETVRAADELSPAVILLSDASTNASAPLLQGINSPPIANYRSTAFGGGPGPDPSNTPVHLQQRLLADTWIEASTNPPGSTLGRVRLITNAAQAEGDDGSQRVPWMKRATLSGLLGSTPTTWSKKLHYTDEMAKAELNPQQLRDTSRLSRSYNTYAELLVDTDQATAAADRALARSVSMAWRGQGDAAISFIRPQQRELNTILRDGVGLTTTPRVTTSGARGVFPITVLNRLAGSDNSDTNAIKVRIGFTSDNSQRIKIDPLTSDVIEAQRNFTGNAQVNASTNGTVQVRAQATTMSGIPVGRPITIDVKVTQAGTVGWFIAIGAGVVLIGATALRIRQVAKERAGTATDTDGPGGPSVDQPTPADGQQPEPVSSPPPVTPPAVPAQSPEPPAVTSEPSTGRGHE